MNAVTLGELRERAAANLCTALGLSPAVALIEAGSLAKIALGGCDDVRLLLGENRPAGDSAAAHYGSLVAQRLRGTPVAHLSGWREFYGIRLRSGPDAFIPRPETELLIDVLRDRLPARDPLRMADLGTGSGAIATALATHFPNSAIMAVDSDANALKLARANTAPFEDRIELHHGGWDAAAGCGLDAVIANPPYLSSAETTEQLASGALCDPPAALDGGADGLACHRQLVLAAHASLTRNGTLALEHGATQQQACADLLRNAGFAIAVALRDLAGLDRVLVGTRL